MWRLISRVWQRFYGFTHAVNQSYTISTLSYAPVVLSKNLARILKQLIINFTMSLDWDRPNTHAQMKPRCSPNRYLGSWRMLLSFSCVLCCSQSMCGRRRRGDWWVEPRAWWADGAREPSLLAPAICSYPRTPLYWPRAKYISACMVCRQGSGKVDFAFAWFPIVLATSVTQIGAPDHAPHLPVLPPALHMLSRAIYSLHMSALPRWAGAPAFPLPHPLPDLAVDTAAMELCFPSALAVVAPGRRRRQGTGRCKGAAAEWLRWYNNS